MDRRKDTATILICRCGWMAVGASFGEVSDEYELHTAGRLGHKDERYIPIANPVIPEAIEMFKKQATVRGDESKALDYLERWREATFPPIEFPMGASISQALRRFVFACAALGTTVIAVLAWRFLR